MHRAVPAAWLGEALAMNGAQKLTLWCFVIGALLACFLGVMYAPLPK